MPPTMPPPDGAHERDGVAIRLVIAPEARGPRTPRGTVVVSLRLPSARAIVAVAFLAVVGAFAVPPLATLARFSAATTNPGNAMQAGTVRLASEAGGAPALVIPALMPGESVDRAIGITSTGTGDARLDLAVIPDATSPFVADPASGLAMSVDRCVGGAWATTTPSAGVPTPLAAGARLACAEATPGVVPSTEALYRGPIVPRGLAAPGAPTATAQAIPLVDRLAPGSRTEFRVRVSLPPDPPGAAPPEGRQGAVTLEWRATGLGTNLGSTPLAGRPAAPVTATPTAIVPVVPTATATATATPSSTPVPTATATPSPTATLPPYGSYALAFNGLADAMQVGWTQATGPLTGRAAWTFEAWVNPASLAATRVLYAETGAGNAGDVLAIRLAPGSGGATRLEVGLRHGGALEWSGADLPANAVATGTWSHLAVAFAEGSRLAVAANGATVATVTTTAATTRPDAPAAVARVARPGEASTGAAFAGLIDEVRAWSVARAYDGIGTDRFQKLVGTEAGLVLHFPIGAYAAAGADARGLVLADESPSGLVGTLSGAVRWVASSAPIDRPATPLDLGLDDGSDEGASPHDLITNETTVTITGTGSPGSVVTLAIDGAASAYQATVEADESFSVDVTVTGGVHEVTAKATGADGKSSMPSATATFTVDVTPPVAGSVTVADTYGASTTDGIVRTTTPAFTLTGASDAGYVGAGVTAARLQVATGWNRTTGFVNDGAAVSPSAGVASFVATALADGQYSVRVAVTDVAGNEAYATPLNVTVDTTPPVVGEVLRLLATETVSTWSSPRFAATATDANGVASVALEIASSASGPFTTSGSPVTQPSNGNAYVVPGPTINGTQWVRVHVTDVAGNDTFSNAIYATAWAASGSDPGWQTRGHAAFVDGWLRFTASTYGDSRDYDQRGGALLATALPVNGALTVSFDLKATGNANGTCVVLVSDTSAFTPFVTGTVNGGDSLGCIGMPGTLAFAGIEEYENQSIRLGPTGDPVNAGTGVESMGGVRYYAGAIAPNTLVNTANDVRVTVLVQPLGSVTRLEVYAQVGASASPTLRMSRTVASGTLPTNGTYLGITGAVGWAHGEHKVRNVVVTGS